MSFAESADENDPLYYYENGYFYQYDNGGSSKLDLLKKKKKKGRKNKSGMHWETEQQSYQEDNPAPLYF